MSTNESHLETLLVAALEIEDEGQRDAFLQGACIGDASRLAQVQCLVHDYFAAGTLLDRPAGGIATIIVSSQKSDAIGSLIGPYKLREVLGEGGMGTVFVAEQEKPVRRKVALKLVKLGMDSKEVLSRFEAERQALALMEHPNIARVLDAGMTNAGRPYFVMELVKGLPITEHCDLHKLGSRERLELFVQVCRAIQHAHQKGIIHRDLKPSNVLVAMHDTIPVVKVIDFGVAKAIGQPLTEKSWYTGLDQMVGTPMYMSPEQAGQSSIDVDTRSDVYSLGVLLYELLTGCTPFEKDTLKRAGFDELRRIIQEVDPPRPSTRFSTLNALASSTIANCRQSEPHKLSQQLRGELDWIVMKALEKDRTRRYESASAFAADVEHYLCDEPVEACPPSTMYRLRKLARRHRAFLTIAGLLMATLVCASGVSVGYALEAGRSSQVAENRGRDLEEKNRALVAAQTRASENYALAKRAVADLVARIAREELAEFPQLAQLRTGLLTNARDFYSELIKSNLDDHELYVQRAGIARSLNDDQAALADYQQALKLAPEDGDLHVTVGSFYSNSIDYRLRSSQLAIPYLQRGLELNPLNADSWYELNRLGIGTDSLKKSYELEQRPAWKQLRLAELRGYPENDLPGALKAFEKALALATDLGTKTEIYYVRAWLLNVRGRSQEAIEDLTLAIEGDGFNHHLFALRGSIYDGLGQANLAAQDWERAVELSGQSWWLRKRLANWHFEHGEYEKSLAHLAGAVEFNPADVGNLTWISLSQIAACPNEAFLKGFRELADTNVRLNKRSGDSLAIRAVILAGLGDLERARVDLREASVAGIQSNWGGFQAAVVALSVNDQETYQSLCRDRLVRDRDSKDPNELNFAAWTCALGPAALGDYTPAIAIARRAVELKADDHQTLLTLAAVLYRAGRFDEALKQLTLVDKLPISKSNSLAYRSYFQAMTHFQLGHADETQHWMEQATAECRDELTAAVPPIWYRRLTLQLLQAETADLLHLSEPTAAERADQPATK